MLTTSILRPVSAGLFALLALGCDAKEPDTMPPEKAPLVVTTDKGAVEGALIGSTRAFLGIPFAEPPVDALRWKPPAPHKPWSQTLKATVKGPACAQLSPLSNVFDPSTKEDCLTVNVWTPAQPSAAPPPVLVWIHGGAFVLGSGVDDAYDGQALSEATGAVVVTMNYRLGPFGFLALPELKSEDSSHPSTGGYGLEDQRAALQWVKTNIAAFGGDAGRVTLFGESAGGMSTCMHLVSPRSKGLFQRAIIESGPCNLATSEAAATVQGKAFVDAVGCKAAPDVLACVRSKSTAAVMSALPLGDFLLGGGASWGLVVDGWNLTDRPDKLLAAGSFEKVPTIVGSNADEGTLFFSLAGAMVPDDKAFEALVEKFVPGHGKEVVAHYPSAMYGSSLKAAMASVGDAAMGCPARQTARLLSKAGVDAYLYFFSYVPKGALFPDLGSFHSAELKYVFANPSQLVPQPLSDEEQALSKSIMGYWSRLAKSGDPNGDGAPKWTKYDAATGENIVFNTTITSQSALKKDLCDFWDTLAIQMP